uniref:DUF349 domain-containing protein n=1 Tax=Roseihalotalea indica TaxID=2867963 RepID=A0AA49JGA4_9BACT|nr:DUF349 domain-containing protein [Tunicatimonas sp. TK19036]
MAEAPENQKEEQPSENIRQEKSKDESAESTSESVDKNNEDHSQVENNENSPGNDSDTGSLEKSSVEDDKRSNEATVPENSLVERDEDVAEDKTSDTTDDPVDADASEDEEATEVTPVTTDQETSQSVEEESSENSTENPSTVSETTTTVISDDDSATTGTGPSEAEADSNKPSDAHDDDDDEDDHEATDYSQLSREELLTEIEKIAKADSTKSTYGQARQMKSHFDEIEDVTREQALQQFVKDGGEEDGFDYKSDTLHEQFYAAFNKIREQRGQQRAVREKTRQQNLEAKQEILNRLRDFVDSEETHVSINKLKELQQEWRQIGEVPPQHNRTLWANYNALLDRFYDNRSIYFELKELDRKKNLEAKIVLAERAELLTEEQDIKKATQELDELHEEYKHIGPVPRDDQEALWQRFKTASDKIHDRRRENVESFKEELKQNLVEKQKLVEEVAEFASYDSDSIKEWNKKTKDIQVLQKRWDAIGSMPRSQAKEVNKQFWSQFKEFFAHKGEFFKRLDSLREENLQKKEALVTEAESLKDSDDWRGTSNELKRLQREWKDIGPVPEKFRETVYQRFKAACDHFFSRRRANSEETEVEYQKNLKAREEICARIEKLAEEKSSDIDELEELTAQYGETGFVPRGAMKSISERYQAAVDKFLSNAKELDDTQKQEVQVSIELGNIKNAPGANRKINQKEGSLRRQISRLEDDISLWKNNISFFASSKQADKLVADVEKKIDKASAELEQLKSQLDVLQNLRED